MGDILKNVKLRDEAYAKLERLVDHVTKHGWMSIGADRGDRVSKESVLSEAVGLLAMRIVETSRNGKKKR